MVMAVGIIISILVVLAKAAERTREVCDGVLSAGASVDQLRRVFWCWVWRCGASGGSGSGGGGVESRGGGGAPITGLRHGADVWEEGECFRCRRRR